MVEWEDPELTSSHKHTKIATIYRAAIHDLFSDLKTSRKKSIAKDKEGTTMRQVGEVETYYSQDPYL